MTVQQAQAAAARFMLCEVHSGAMTPLSLGPRLSPNILLIMESLVSALAWLSCSRTPVQNFSILFYSMIADRVVHHDHMHGAAFLRVRGMQPKRSIHAIGVSGSAAPAADLPGASGDRCCCRGQPSNTMY